MPVAHLGHAEIRVTNLEEARRFYTDILGLIVSEEDDERVYLRAWQDWDHHTLVLHQGERPGIEHVGWRAGSPEELAALERRLRELGLEYEWLEGGVEAGQGDALRFRTPTGLPFEVYWEREVYSAPSEVMSRLPSHPTRFWSHGIAPRRFDHVNFLINDVAAEQRWLTEELGLHHRYYAESSSGDRLGSWLSRTNVSHEIAVMRNREQTGSMLHHVAYYVDSPDQLLRAATILADNGIKIEWGPGSHGTSGAIFLYFFDPSGNRIEVWTGGFLIFAPDWEPIRWTPELASHAYEMWGSGMPESYLTYGTEIVAFASLGADRR